jgi:hypothetical protein
VVFPKLNEPDPPAFWNELFYNETQETTFSPPEESMLYSFREMRDHGLFLEALENWRTLR